jgi:hypothetical protein
MRPHEHGSTCKRESDAQPCVEHHRIRQDSVRRSRGLLDGLLDLVDKLLAKARTLFAVPDGCFLKFVFRSAPENDAKRHRLSRDRTDALTSSQGTTSAGKESSSATRRSNSARCSSVSRKALASAHMVAQISSTSASRSSTLSRSMPKLLTELPIITSDYIGRHNSRGRCNHSSRHLAGTFGALR